MVDIKVKKLFENAVVPTRANPTDAGYDLYSSERVSIPAGATVLVSTGISISIPDGYAGLIWDRSSMGVKGIHRYAGVIDSGYRGHIKVCLHNASCDVYHIDFGDRIAQIIIQEAPHFNLTLADSLEDSDRGKGGFGSTGR
jgi:dUTP pyrophosphatase|tara:strand:- start:11206 stop:11628 length:423 start_codon:yes stop_codon:yes gene_type:complete